MSIYKACDIRGHYGVDLLDEHARRLGFAIGQFCGPIDVLVGGDGRISTPGLKAHLVAALSQAGCRVVDLGIVPTPALYFARQHYGIQSALMVTASHNPAADNGFKLSLGETPIQPQEIRVLADLMESDAQPAPTRHAAIETVDVLPHYIAFARSQAQDLRGLRVVVDCANGAAALVARQVWEGTGAMTDYLCDTVDGRFPNHPPDPSVAGNLQMLCREVLALNAQLGVAYDGDGDRVIFVDSLGRPVSGDRAIVLFVRQALRSGPAPIVYDQKCSSIVPDTIRELGGQPIIERSGHTFIKTTFLRERAPYAGEVSGHHFFQVLKGDDGVIASLYMANLIHESGHTLTQLADAIRAYPITPDIRLRMEDAMAHRVLEQLGEALDGEARMVRLDGLRAEFPDGWGIARLSVTEPAITLRFEGRDLASLKRIMLRFEQAAPDLSGRLPTDLPDPPVKATG